VICEQNCGQNIKQKYLKIHVLDECINTILDCPFESCGAKVKRIDIQAHINEKATYHLFATGNLVKDLKKLVLQQQQQILLHQQQILQQQQEIMDMKKQFNDKWEGNYMILNHAVNTGLDLDYGSNQNGTKVSGYKIHGGVNQLWILKKSSSLSIGILYYKLRFKYCSYIGE